MLRGELFLVARVAFRDRDCGDGCLPETAMEALVVILIRVKCFAASSVNWQVPQMLCAPKPVATLLLANGHVVKEAPAFAGQQPQPRPE